MKTIPQIIEFIQSSPARSAWQKGVKLYALELMENYPDLLNGARDWREFSYGGCTLIYNGDIAERLCSPSELKRTKNGEHQPNSRENWLDVQARALSQAAFLIKKATK